MDQAAKDQPQVRGVKRKPGRPRKATPEDVARIAYGVDAAPQALKVIEYAASIAGDEGLADRARAQQLASRIWYGQSPDLSRAERLERVKRGLEAQGLSMEGVTL